MKNLVITVSPDSSIELLAPFANIIIVDKEPLPKNMPRYDTLYIRSHFGQPETLPQNFHTETEDLVRRARHGNPDIRFIDHTDSIEEILNSEDKWLQYETFTDFMPRTQLFDSAENEAGFECPVFKKRLSSRGKGVTWNIEEVAGSRDDWIIQESLGIDEELRVYVICGEVYPIAVVRQSKTPQQSTQAVSSRALTQDETDFSLEISNKVPSLDMIGLDIARTSDGRLSLMEANRSPGFAAFFKLTGVNLAEILYSSVEA